MKRLFQFAFGMVVLFALSGSAFGQQTSIQATILDPTGRAYNFATGSASIACPGNQQPTFNGSPLARTLVISGIDGNGHFTMVLWNTAAIQPSGCTWRFSITWQDGITSFTTGNIGGVTGTGPVDLSAAISAYAVLLPPVGGGGATPCVTTPNALQFNQSGALGCTQDITWSLPHTLLAGASAVINWAAAAGISLAPVTSPLTSKGSANSLSMLGSATTLPVALSSSGSDTDSSIQLKPKGYDDGNGSSLVLISPTTTPAQSVTMANNIGEPGLVLETEAGAAGNLIFRSAGNSAGSHMGYMTNLFVSHGGTLESPLASSPGDRAGATIFEGYNPACCNPTPFAEMWGYVDTTAGGDSLRPTGSLFWGLPHNGTPFPSLVMSSTAVLAVQQGWDFTVYNSATPILNPDTNPPPLLPVNFERGCLKWVANVFTICTEHGGSGSARAMNLSAAAINLTGPTTASGLANTLSTKSAPYTLTANDGTILVTGTTTITLPHAIVGQWWNVFNSGGATVTLVADSGNVNGVASVTLAANIGALVTCDGTNCFADLGGGGGGGSSITLQTNGTNNTSQSTLNFQTSTNAAVAGRITPSNPSTGNEQFDITNLQGTDGKVLTSGTVSGAGNVLCTDAQLGATTASCGSTLPALPTSPNSVPQYITSTPSGGVGVAPVWSIPGIPVNFQTGTTYTVLATDRGTFVTLNNAASVAVTLPIAGSTGFGSLFTTVLECIGAGTCTITPTTSTINGNATLVLTTGEVAFITSNNINYFATVQVDTVYQPVAQTLSTNVTPVTVATSTTADQNLMALTLQPNRLNTVGRTLKVWSAGVYSTPVASSATVTLEAKLCTVSGCGSGTVIDVLDITSSANPGTVTNNAWNLTGYITTQTAGASAVFESHGIMGIDLGALNTSADSFFNDTNAGVSSTIDSTGTLFLQISVAFSAASSSNSCTQRQLVVESVN